MNAPFLLETMPDAPSARGPWLDRALVGRGLDQLVAELEALGAAVAAETAPQAEPAADPADLDAALGPHRDAVLTDGVAAAPAGLVAALLARPALLITLRTLVLEEGGPHWDAVAAEDPELLAAAERVAAVVAERLADAPAPPPAKRASAQPEQASTLRRGGILPPSASAANGSLGNDSRRESAAGSRRDGEPPVAKPLPEKTVAAPPKQERRGSGRSLVAAGLSGLAGLALGFLVAVFMDVAPQLTVPVATIGWGWAGPEGLPQADSPRAYLNELADEAEEWFGKRPEDAPAVAKRIAEFRAGCSVLILAEHPALSPASAELLREKCRNWAAALDAQLAAVEAGEPPIEVRSRTDETVRKLIDALRGEAILNV
ncbi:hypothetical protein [Alienimonas californiensis]|uniref:Uncharacterized protein n=1 Tax=Alienimonas californiensis TaxID=2527989 RepID=A0A517P6K9_9PLAN|nr:hypothetical protein [Alienimonas californiensis]QDT14993.1 hypothetical protein CA12_10730 [Alienimonas californiensis]